MSELGDDFDDWGQPRPVVDSSRWTGLKPTAWEQDTGDSRAGWWAFRFELWRYEMGQRAKALAMLWGPGERDRPRDLRKGWTVYDGWVTQRGDDWTLWRGLVATFAILTGRMHGQRQLERHGYQPSFDLGHWDFRRTYGGWAAAVLQLYPGARVEIFRETD